MLRMKNILSGLAMLLLATISFQLDAQSSKVYGEIFIPDNSSISIFSKHNFHDGNGLYPGQISTERDNNKGYINFSRGSSWVGASDMQYIDGYAKVYHNEAFTFPTGANSRFRPVAISGASRTSAAYYDNDPSFINESGTSKLEPLHSENLEPELILAFPSSSKFMMKSFSQLLFPDLKTDSHFPVNFFSEGEEKLTVKLKSVIETKRRIYIFKFFIFLFLLIKG